MAQKSLVNLVDSDFQEIRNLAALFFTPREVATMLELPATEFVAECDNEHSLCFVAFHGGRLQAEVDLRKSVLMLAKSGSSPAQTMALDMLNKSKLKMMDR